MTEIKERKRETKDSFTTLYRIAGCVLPNLTHIGRDSVSQPSSSGIYSESAKEDSFFPRHNPVSKSLEFH